MKRRYMGIGRPPLPPRLPHLRLHMQSLFHSHGGRDTLAHLVVSF